MPQDPPHREPVDPPPPPPMMMMIGFGLTAAAAVAGFLGCCTTAGVLATLGLAFGVASYFQTRGTVEIPASAIDSEGRLKSYRRPQ
jgi:hypothetical protein